MTIQYNTSTVEYDNSTFTYTGGLSGVSANLPILGVFIAFTSGAYDVNPNWVEVTQYVRQVTINRGRTDELEQFQGGNATVLLDNRTRIFDPFNTDGAYYGNLKPRKQIKIVAQWAGVQYPMFRGFVSGFPVQWTESGKDTVTTVDCFDLMSFMGAENIGADWVVSYLQELGAINIVRNDVKEGVFITEDVEVVERRATQPNFGISGGNNIMSETLIYKPAPVQSGNLTPSESIMAVGSPKSISMTGNGYALVEVQPPRVVASTGAGALVFWVQVDSAATARDDNNGFIDLLYGLHPSGSFNVGVAFNQTYATTLGSLIVRLFQGGSTTYLTTNLAINDGQPHCIVINHDGSAWNMFVDGRNVNTSGFSQSGFFPVQQADLVNTGTDQTIVFGYAATLDRDLTTTEITTLSAYGSNSFAEPSDERFTRLVDSSNVPTAFLDIDDLFEYFDVDALPQQGTALLPALQQVANSEGSVMFVDGAGVLHFWSRNTIFANPESATSQVTFADDGTAFPYANRSLRVTLDGDQMRNEITVTDSADRAVTVKDDASILANGVSAETISSILVDVDSSQELATRTVNIFKNPDIDIEPFTLQGQYDTNYWDDLLGLELLHRFTFKRQPDVGSAIVKEMLVQQMTWNMTPSTWECTIKGSARFTGWFTVGLSLVGGSDVVL